ncbi:MAG: hypothetical protein QOI03_1318, partial [Solirubrobacteraceae bacterium]|nr:hypothetical protein [Solirubrobacteraceae bacterium]
RSQRHRAPRRAHLVLPRSPGSVRAPRAETTSQTRRRHESAPVHSRDFLAMPAPSVGPARCGPVPRVMIGVRAGRCRSAVFPATPTSSSSRTAPSPSSAPKLKPHLELVARYALSPHEQPVGEPLTDDRAVIDEFLLRGYATERDQLATMLLREAPEIADRGPLIAPPRLVRAVRMTDARVGRAAPAPRVPGAELL